MFVRLTRSSRASAGWLVALLYLVCVLAPGAALALGGPAPWLPAEIEQAAEHQHDHTGHGTSHQHGSEHAAHQADSDGAKHKHDSKNSPGPCCAMLGLSAMTADVPAIAQPMEPRSIRISESIRSLHGTTPPLLDRPPNT
jgi:hypothetical protein